MRKFAVLILVLFLAACDPYPVAIQAPTAINPHLALADGRATQDAALAIIQGTQDVIDAANFQATSQAQATEGALQVELQLLSAQATATMQAYQIESARAQATESARAVAIQQTAQASAVAATAQAVQEQVTSTAQAALVQTAQAWQITQTPLAATQAAIAQTAEQERIQSEWSAVLIPVKTLFWPAFWSCVLVLLVVAIALAYRRLMPILDLRLRTVPRRGDDNPLILLNDMLIDATRMFGPALHITASGAQISGAAHPALQAEVTSRAQLVDAMRALPRDGSGRQASKAILQKAMPTPAVIEQPEAEIVAAALPPVAPWRMLESWQAGALPLGLTSAGLLTADPETQPHLLVAGTTGSGKTRYGLRPAIAGALASGWQVAILDRSGLDFLPFERHPNCQLITLDNPEDAIGYLAAFFLLVQARLRILRDNQASTWSRLPSAEPRQLVVMDEFSNLADSLDNTGRDELWRQARMVAAEGRKAGCHLAIALQDPTARSIDLRIRRNMTPLSFRVRDDSASRVILNSGGAESLAARQFMTVIGADLIRGVAFSPSDADLTDFMDAHPAGTLPSPAWLDGRSMRTVSPQDSQAERIREMHASGASMRQIETAIFGYTGGRANETVKAVIGRATTTTDMPATGVVDVVAL